MYLSQNKNNKKPLSNLAKFKSNLSLARYPQVSTPNRTPIHLANLAQRRCVTDIPRHGIIGVAIINRNSAAAAAEILAGFSDSDGFWLLLFIFCNIFLAKKWVTVRKKASFVWSYSKVKSDGWMLISFNRYLLNIKSISYRHREKKTSKHHSDNPDDRMTPCLWWTQHSPSARLRVSDRLVHSLTSAARSRRTTEMLRLFSLITRVERSAVTPLPSQPKLVLIYRPR